MTDVMKIIRKERKRQHLSQEKLAYLVQVDKTSIHFWETYKFTPKFDTVENMLNALGLEIVIQKKGTDDEQMDCTEALTLLWIHKFITDNEFYHIDARLKQTEPQTDCP